jgi:bifunctional pyridoxal-dependent enzyme with beta-cystathionase and maltose regulon repressor activities
MSAFDVPLPVDDLDVLRGRTSAKWRSHPDDVQRLFLDRGRVAVEPGPKYGPPGDGWVRLNFGTSASILDAAVDRMARALNRRPIS